MNTNLIPALILLLVSVTACTRNSSQFDASGNFEADEVIVSSELSGKILSLNVEEGSLFSKDSIVGSIDAANVSLQKEQIEATIQSLKDKTLDVLPQIK